MESFLQFEADLLINLQQLLHAEWLTALMKGITFLSEYGAIEIALCLVLMICPGTRRLGIVCSVSLVVTFVCCNLILKPLIDRPRPWEIFSAINAMLPDPGDASFPSGHSANSMSVVWALFLNTMPRRGGQTAPSYDTVPCLGWRGKGADPRTIHRWSFLAVMLALLTGLSRLYLGMHFPSDVAAGLLLGMICAGIVHLVFKKIEASRGIIGNVE